MILHQRQQINHRMNLQLNVWKPLLLNRLIPTKVYLSFIDILTNLIYNLDNETRITRRSIRVPASTNSGESRSRSISGENHREHHPNLSSSEESLSKKD
jgi:hypothetical protein